MNSLTVPRNPPTRNATTTSWHCSSSRHYTHRAQVWSKAGQGEVEVGQGEVEVGQGEVEAGQGEVEVVQVEVEVGQGEWR